MELYQEQTYTWKSVLTAIMCKLKDVLNVKRQTFVISVANAVVCFPATTFLNASKSLQSWLMCEK